MEKARNQNDLQFLLIFSYTYMYLLIKILRFLRVIFFHKFYFPKNERKINHCVVSFWMKNFLFNMNNKHLFSFWYHLKSKLIVFHSNEFRKIGKMGIFFLSFGSFGKRWKVECCYVRDAVGWDGVGLKINSCFGFEAQENTF